MQRLPPDIIKEISKLVIEFRRAKCQEIYERMCTICKGDFKYEKYCQTIREMTPIVQEIIDDELLTQEMRSIFDWFYGCYKMVYVNDKTPLEHSDPSIRLNKFVKLIILEIFNI